MFTAAKYSYGKLITSLSNSSNKENAVPATVSMEYIDKGSTSGEKVEYYHNLSNFMNGLASLGSANWPITRSKYGISVCPNLVNINDQNGIIEIIFDIRAMYRDSNGHRDVMDLLISSFKPYVSDIKGEILLSINTVNVDSEDILPKTVTKVANDNGYIIIDVGEKLGGASDTRFFTDLGIPGVEIGMPGGNEHGSNEWTTLSSLHQFKKLYYDIYLALIEL